MREGQYTVYAISTPNKKEAEAMLDRLKPLNIEMKLVKDGKLHRVQFGAPTAKRHTAQKKIDTLTRAGILTAHMIYQ